MYFGAVKQYFSIHQVMRKPRSGEQALKNVMSKHNSLCIQKTDFFPHSSQCVWREADVGWQTLLLSISKEVTALIQLDIYDGRCSLYH